MFTLVMVEETWAISSYEFSFLSQLVPCHHFVGASFVREHLLVIIV